MMNVEDKSEIIPVTFGAIAIAFSLVIWHKSSDNETIAFQCSQDIIWRRKRSTSRSMIQFLGRIDAVSVGSLLRLK